MRLSVTGISKRNSKTSTGLRFKDLMKASAVDHTNTTLNTYFMHDAWIVLIPSLSGYYKSFKAYPTPPGGLKQPTLGYDNRLGSYAV
jgi:hypothetical protein